jgi:hypothetical protein
MNLIADLMWIAGAALSLGFIVYGGCLLLFVPRLPDAAPRLRLAS